MEEKLNLFEERLKYFLAMEGMSPAQLADRVNVQRSGISHLLQGRNKPSFEFITKMIVAFPNINPDWLIMGTGKAYRNGVAAPAPATGTFEEKAESGANMGRTASSPSVMSGDFDLFNAGFSNSGNRSVETTPELPQKKPSSRYNSAVEQQGRPATTQTVQQQYTAQTPVSEQIASNKGPSYPSENRVKSHAEALTPSFSTQKQIKQIVVFFTDGTYEIR